MEKKFSASFNKKGKDLYNIVLEAILNLDLKLVSEDDKNLTIDAKTRMNWQNFGLNLNFSINGSKIKLISSTFQVTDYGESEKISKKIFNEIKKLSLSKKKNKPIKKEKIEQSIQKTKKSSQSKMIWWISGVVGFVVLLMVVGSGGSGGVSCQLLGDNGRNSCEYRCYKSGKSKLFYSWKNGPTDFCHSFPHYYSNDGRKPFPDNDIFKD